MSLKKPLGLTFLLALAASAALSLTAPSNATEPQSAATGAKATKATPGKVKENNETVREMTAPENIVSVEGGSKHAETGPAKPVESWMSACPPHGEQRHTSAPNYCRQSDDSGKQVEAR